MIELKVKRNLEFKKREPIKDITNCFQNNLTTNQENKNSQNNFTKYLIIGTIIYTVLNYNNIKTKINDFFYNNSISNLENQNTTNTNNSYPD
jgi:hypothetical protein